MYAEGNKTFWTLCNSVPILWNTRCPENVAMLHEHSDIYFGTPFNMQISQVAEYSATLENYEKAIKIYEQVAAASLENQLLKYAAKDQFFRASLCHLCIDMLNAQHAIQKYEEQYPAFGDSREAKLVKVIIL